MVEARTLSLPGGGSRGDAGFSIALRHADDSHSTIDYLANGDRRLGKERCEVMGGGMSGVLDNFRSLRLFGPESTRKMSHRLRQDKGHRAEWMAVREAVLSGVPAIPLEDLWIVASTSLGAVESLENGAAFRPGEADLGLR